MKEREPLVKITSRAELRRDSPLEGQLGEEIVRLAHERGVAVKVTRQRAIPVERGTLHVDLALEVGVSCLAVEVDGFEYHHATRDQVESDYRRDRSLARAGWRVIRFLGREVIRSPAGCAAEALDVLFAGGSP